MSRLRGTTRTPDPRRNRFATLERAREALRVSKSFSRKAILDGGVYRITKTLTLGPEDSGMDKAPVVWEAAHGQTVRIMGGVRLAGWRSVDDPSVLARLRPEAREHVVRCDLGAMGIERLGAVQPRSGIRSELFFNRRYMTLARYPNEGWLTIADVPPDAQYKVKDRDDPKLTRHKGPFRYDGARPSQWADTSDLWVHGYWTYDWSDEFQQVDKLDRENALVWPKQPYHVYGYSKGQRYYFLNVLEELDSPGEWFLDRSTKTIYFWPPDAIEGAEVTFPDLEAPMLALDNARYISVRGITFECSRAEAVVIKGGEGNEVVGCVARNVGRTAIDITGGLHHQVRSCDIYDTAAAGIRIAGGDRKTLTPAGHAVVNCDIHRYAQVQKTYQPAVSIEGVGNRIAHCYIHDAPHQGIAYAGNDHIIEYCEFTRIAHETGDVGVIYSAMDWSYMGHEFRYNYFHAIHGPGELGCFTIYPDLPCGGIHLLGNVFYDVDQGYLTNSGRGMTVENNFFLRCARTFRFNVWNDYPMFRPGGAWRMAERLDEVNYSQPPYSERYPALARLAEDFAKGDAAVAERTIPRDNVIRNNISTGPHFIGLGAQAGLQDVRLERNLICNSVVMTGSPSGDGKTLTYFAEGSDTRNVLEPGGNVAGVYDPGLVDPEGHDFRLRRDSPARALGIRDVPFRRMGLERDAYRTRLPIRAPEFAPVSRVFVGETDVRLLVSRKGGAAAIHYTLDGSEPTAASPVYRAPLHLSASTTIKAKAIGTGAGSAGASEVVSATYVAEYLGRGHGAYASDLEESAYVGDDGLGNVGLRKNCAPHGQPIRLGGEIVTKALMTSPVDTPEGAASWVSYALTHQLRPAEQFTALVGLDGTDSPELGACAFVVELRQGRVWRRAFESGPVRAGQAPVAVRVDLRGADEVRLKVEGSGPQHRWPQAVWASPLFQ